MAITLLTTNTGSDVSDSSFTSSIDSTYKLYIFKIVDVNPATDGEDFMFQANATDSSSYNRTMTTTYWRGGHNEADDSTFGGQSNGYVITADQGAGTDYQELALNVGNGADESLSGELYLFHPSNTSYMKWFRSTMQYHEADNHTITSFCQGYLDDTTAIDDIQFKMSSGNMDATIKLWGVG